MIFSVSVFNDDDFSMNFSELEEIFIALVCHFLSFGNNKWLCGPSTKKVTTQNFAKWLIMC